MGECTLFTKARSRKIMKHTCPQRGKTYV